MDHLHNVSYFKFLRVNLMGGPRIRRLLLGLPVVAQWLRLHASNAGAAGSIPGQGTRILHALGATKKEEEEMAKYLAMKTYLELWIEP